MFTGHRYHIMHGGRGGGKSVFVAATLAIEGWLQPRRILCAREIQLSISESVMAGLWDAIVDLGLDDFYTKTRTEITGANGTTFLFMGLRSNITKIKSIANIDFVWVEEAEAVTKDSWDTLIPSIRANGSRIIITFNPKNILDDTYQRFVVNTPPDSVRTEINWLDNPFFPPVLDAERRHMLSTDPDLYEHVWMGQPVADGHLSIINPRHVRAALDAHIKLRLEPDGKYFIGFDVADTGDRCCLIHRQGPIAHDMEYWRANPDELLKSTTKAFQQCQENNAHLIYDVCGIGASVAPKLNELNTDRNQSGVYHIDTEYTKFNAADGIEYPEHEYKAGVKNKDFFCNAKAQLWWHVADLFRNTYDAITNGTEYPADELISISSGIRDVEQLMAELGLPQRDLDNNGRVKVESKKDLDKRGVPSPDLADAFVMAFKPAQTMDLSSLFGSG